MSLKAEQYRADPQSNPDCGQWVELTIDYPAADACVYCGYPFALGDQVWQTAGEECFCSRSCAWQHRDRQVEIREREIRRRRRELVEA